MLSVSAGNKIPSSGQILSYTELTILGLILAVCHLGCLLFFVLTVGQYLITFNQQDLFDITGIIC